MSVRRLHMIGNAHIDPVWLWQWPEGYQEVRATFQSAIDRMEEYPDFVFTCDSSLFFEWVEESDPALFERVQARIADGRFQVVGGWWIEPDCNIPGGESLVRQALYGQRYLREKFGIVATTGANLDSFGHSAAIPQILAKSGIDSYVFLRPGPEEKTLESPIFWWESPDGSRVLAYRIPHEYCAPKDDLGDHVEKALASLPDGDEEYAVFYGVGNHGGGPTKSNLDQIARLNEEGDGPRLELSSLRRFFDGLARENGAYPTIRGELQHHAPGCYTTHSGIKRWNRRAENLLAAAEKWSAVADSLGLRPYPLDGADARVEAAPLQPVPRHARRHLDRARLRGRARPDRACIVARGQRLQRGDPVDRAADRRSSPRRRCGRSSSSTRTRGRSSQTSRSSTRGCGRRALTSSTTRASACRCS